MPPGPLPPRFPLLPRWFILWTSLLVAPLLRAQSPPPPTPPPEPEAVPLTTLRELRALPPKAAPRPRPVHVRGVITALNWGSTAFIQDETGGSFFNLRPTFPPLHPGDEVEVRGKSTQSGFVPGIDAQQCLLLGRRPLPHPVQATYDDLLSGRLQWERVSLSGIVRSQEEREPNVWTLKLALGSQRLEILYRPEQRVPPPPLVDARVRISGLAAGVINLRRQLAIHQIYVNELADVAVEQPPPPLPFEAPLLPFSELLQFRPDGILPHRVRVRGAVTHHQPGELLCLREGKVGLFVRSTQATPLAPGDLVEAIGFPVMGNFSAQLEDAEFRRIGKDSPPAPLAIPIAEALRGTHDANLVTLEARLLETLHGPGESVLLLRSGDTAFEARLPRSPLALRPGSLLRLCGVCRVEASSTTLSFRASPKSFELLLRSPNDIQLLAAPSPWTARNLAAAALALLLLALAALVWVAVLRRRVRSQTEIIRSRIEREAVLEERQRVAREIHDTLAQSFSGVGFQLEALDARLPDEPALRQSLATAKHLVRHGQEEFRRSLLNLRACELERGSLAEALAETGRLMTAGSGTTFELRHTGLGARFPEAVENNLLRIAQECLTNALRHAQASKITAELSMAQAQLRLQIQDNGRGFDPASLTSLPEGHFGWQGIRERAAQIHARVSLESTPGKGTSITLTVPLDPAAPSPTGMAL